MISAEELQEEARSFPSLCLTAIAKTPEGQALINLWSRK